MRSRTSQGVLEWFGGKDLYIGSPVSASGKVSGVTGIVPGPPEGSRGSTGWGHLSRRAPWAEVAWEPAPDGLVRPTQGPKTPRVGNPRGPLPPEGACTLLVGNPKGGVAPGPPLFDGISKGACAPLAPIYSGRKGGQPHLALGASLSLCNTSPPCLCLAKPCRDPTASTTMPP